MDPEPAELFNVLMQCFYPVRGGILGAMRSSGASQQSGVAERDLEVSWNSECSFCPPKPCRIPSSSYTPNIQELRRRQWVKDKVQAQHQNKMFFTRVQECMKG